MTKHNSVLMIDDDEATLDIYSTLLTSRGCGIIAARDGRMGLLMAREFQPKLIILDMILPDDSGLDVLRELKGRPETCCIPVIILSNAASVESRLSANLLGAETYLVKTDLKPSEVWPHIAIHLDADRSDLRDRS